VESPLYWFGAKSISIQPLLIIDTAHTLCL
jgi:hypothetical protein